MQNVISKHSGAVPAPRTASEAVSSAEVVAVLNRAVAPRLVLQPIVGLRSGVVEGHEALARFGASLSTPPGRWFDAASRLGRSAELEALLVEQALALRSVLPGRRFLAVNVSPAALVTTAVQRAFAGFPDLTDVIVELTEHAEFDQAGTLQEHLRGLRARGAQLALDDVGAGWAGLRQVSDLRPDIVKLDRSIVSAADRDPVKLALVEMMLNLCTRLGTRLLVEGVQTPAELDVFARLGVPLAQGWIFGEPALEPPRIDEDLAVRLKFMAGLARHVDKLASVIDVTAPWTLQGRAGAQPGPQDGDSLVVVDVDRRPVSLLVREHGGVWPPRSLPPSLTRPPTRHCCGL
ncbi:MAG: hypothetical protein NVS3B26_12980 [Mycobacteriales bacterium]